MYTLEMPAEFPDTDGTWDEIPSTVTPQNENPIHEASAPASVVVTSTAEGGKVETPPRHVMCCTTKANITEVGLTKLSLEKLPPKKALVMAPIRKAPLKIAPPKKATPKKATPKGARTTRPVVQKTPP